LDPWRFPVLDILYLAFGGGFLIACVPYVLACEKL
jgi:hypothetical protein